MVFLDLFCGAGGLSRGFEAAGFKCLAGIDNSKSCIETHKFNFPDSKAILGNIELLKPEYISKKIRRKKLKT